jgi:hypothetical protein
LSQINTLIMVILDGLGMQVYKVNYFRKVRFF